MENEVIFRSNQEVQADDLNNMQGYISQEFDDLITDAIDSGQAYTGLTIGITAQTQVTVQPGRLYWNGEVYVLAQATMLDFYNNLPVTQETYCAVVAWGQNNQTNVQPRRFLVNATTGQAQPQAVAMQSINQLNLSIVAGVEAAAPSYPNIPATALVVGFVLLNPQGVMSVIQSTDTQLANLTTIAQQVAQLVAFEAQVAGQISTLATALAALSASLANYVTQTDFMKLVTLVGQINDKLNALILGLTNTYLFYGTDNFLDTSQSQTSANIDGAYSATINEGLRFPGVTSLTRTTLMLLNPNDPSVIIASDGFLLPRPSGTRVRMDCSFKTFDWTEDRILQYGYFTQPCRQLSRSRKRECCGSKFVVTPQAQVWYYQAQQDPTTRILSFITESWEIKQWSLISDHEHDDSPDWPKHQWERREYHWRDEVDLHYWAKVFTTASYAGNYVFQSFLNQQDGWLAGVTIYSTQLYFQPLSLLVMACDNAGRPDPTQVLSQVTLTGAQVQNCFNQPHYPGDLDCPSARWGESRDRDIPVNRYALRIPIPPTFLVGGKKYAYMVHTTYDHRWAISTRYECFASHNGAFWCSGANGFIQWTTGNKSHHFKLHYLVWGQWQDNSAGTPTSPGPITVQLQPLTMAGGVGSVEVLAETIVPSATSLVYQVQLGGNWVSFGPDPNQPNFSSSSTLVPFQMIFNGTADLMPGINLTQSQVTVHNVMSGALHHISTDIMLGSTSTHVKIITKLNGFQATHHTFNASIHGNYVTGGAFNLKYNPSTTTDNALADGTLERTFVWNLANAIQDFVVELDGTQDNTVPSFTVGQRVAFAAA